MRRGHPGFGGWRNENDRRFRPRIGGNPHYKPPRNFNIGNSRFSPSTSRPHRPIFNPRPEHDEREQYDHRDRHRYRKDNTQSSYIRSKDRAHHSERQFLPHVQRMRQSEDFTNSYKNNPNLFNKSYKPDQYLINNMGDIDQRQSPQKHKYLHSNPSWSVDNLYHDVDDRNYYNNCQNDSDHNNFPGEYTGHRPPSSDHYGGNPTPTIEKSNTFSRSVDDTVDIVRKRLLNRNENQHALDNQEQIETAERNIIESPLECPSNLQEPKSKRRITKQKPTNKVSCDTIKNKIVHQLFKMDKEKIHKLLDNPNCSTKFEYAINSLLTESQNSFNQHIRSVAEKSLCSSSTEFMQNDNNTIYEDTFMKQMQCILDPQDTILLEDIKPIVMAELSKVLQIDDFDHNFRVNEDNYSSSYQREDFPNYDMSNMNEEYCDSRHTIPTTNVNFQQEDLDYNPCEMDGNLERLNESRPLYERRPRQLSCSDRDVVSEQRFRKSLDSRVAEIFPTDDTFNSSHETQPLFVVDSQFSEEEEDPFAELDNQYHVAVDHDFIENNNSPTSLVLGNNSTNHISTCQINQTKIQKNTSENLALDTQNIKQEIDSQIQAMATLNSDALLENNQIEIDTLSKPCHKITQQRCSRNSTDVFSEINKSDDIKDTWLDIPTIKISKAINSEKRSNEQRPSHRKEKHKKSEDYHDSGKQPKVNISTDLVQNKTLANSSSKTKTNQITIDSCFPPKDKKIVSSESNKIKLTDKNSEKYVKKSHIKENENRKRQSSTSSNHSISPGNNNTIPNIDIQAKQEPKSVLKTIDMFTEQPKKTTTHQSFKNTNTPNIVEKSTLNAISKSLTFDQHSIKQNDVIHKERKKMSKKTQTLVFKNTTSRFCQTERKKLMSKHVQTDFPEKGTGIKATDAFERMKEIDLEIQLLLQEKFKLYSSLESKTSQTVPMQTLGMTVLNVSSFNENNDEECNNALEDTIVSDFTNIPEDDLEQITVETVQVSQNEPQLSRGKKRRRKVSLTESYKSLSPFSKKSKKTPNISLIEQIITDDRPIEDIILLDDLEIAPVNSKKGQKLKNPRRKPVSKNKNKSSKSPVTLKECSVCLIREDLSKYFYKNHELANEIIRSDDIILDECIDLVTSNTIVIEDSQEVTIVEESIMNDLQLDMLDVSEDIVIGENCNIGKDIEVQSEVLISEELILDNSQSSIDNVTPAAHQGGECKLFDYSSDDNLRHDSVLVNGNGDAVLAVECVENNFLAACLDGNVYYFNADGQLLTTLRGSNLAVTCLTIVKEKYGITVYTGSLDSRIRYYDLETGLEKGLECNVLSPIQTMDRAWDTVFVGTRTGFVLQFECKNNMLIPISTVKFSDNSILALRAMKEGPRKVLLVAARSEDVTIRDAQSGLMLRTLSGPKMTVYTLLYEDGKVYCGTSSHQIHVFDYTSGSQVGAHEGGKGAVCLLARGGLVFAGCYDGCVYVYRDGETSPLAQLRGPPSMLLSLTVLSSKIIAGYKDRSLYIWKIPLCILQEMIL